MIPYRGRFAPSPTGPLHFGSLVAAVASYCEARCHGGLWFVRMEDLDSPRTVPGAAKDILRTLERLGFEWHGQVMAQSRRTTEYADALESLKNLGRVFACGCSRKEIADSMPSFAGEHVYPGTCRNGLPPGRDARALRLRVDRAIIDFEDAVQGPLRQDLARVIGDFVLRRADGIHAYQLAVAVDDAAQSITDVVRGADLLDSTPRQILIQQLLAYTTPRYAHVPVAVNPAGEKLSKQTLAQPIDTAHGEAELVKALRFLGQPAPGELQHSNVTDIWHWALANWNLSSVPRQRTAAAPD
ncbi:MAG: tRNA glutamyl-Q(34) synthetase GluQRS [Betaproteobacteria bacterium]|nr:tRNA glutamyl-Q(34) synthetase GluQRS [Betaproteobacteria bacterium]